MKLDLSGLNYWAVLAAAVATFMLGGAWYTALFGKLWFFQSVPAFFQMLFAPRGKTPEALAARLGLPADALRRTLARYAQDARSGATDALGKSADFCAPLDRPWSAP